MPLVPIHLYDGSGGLVATAAVPPECESVLLLTESGPRLFQFERGQYREQARPFVVTEGPPHATPP